MWYFISQIYQYAGDNDLCINSKKFENKYGVNQIEIFNLREIFTDLKKKEHIDGKTTTYFSQKEIYILESFLNEFLEGDCIDDVQFSAISAIYKKDSDVQLLRKEINNIYNQ